MYCAMIGDLIQSKAMESNQREAVQLRLKQVLDEINLTYSSYLVSPFLVTLGDEFQGLLTAAEPTLEMMELIDRNLAEYGVRVRYGIGLGEISTSINRERALGDDGPAYHLAREGVAFLKQENWSGFPVSIRTKNPDTALLQSICCLLNEMAETWSGVQRQYILDMELMNEQLLVARKNEVEQSSVSRALKRGHYKTYRQTKETLSEYLLTVYDCPESAGRQGQYNRAITLNRNRKYEEAAAILKELMGSIPEKSEKQLPTKTDIAFSLSKSYSGLFQYDRAIQVIKEALPLAESRTGKIKLLGQLGYYFSEASQAAADQAQRKQLALQAIQHAKEALALCEEDDARKATLQSNLAFAYEKMENREQAIALREELRQKHRASSTQNKKSEITNLHNLSCMYWQEGQKEKAMELIRETLSLSDQLITPFSGVGEVYLSYAWFLFKTGVSDEEIIATTEKALQFYKRDQNFKKIKDICKFLKPLYQKTENQDGINTCMELQLQAENRLKKGT